MKILYKGFNFSQDGPGNRLVYHLQGCNMHCPWCSNPEGMSLLGGTEVSVRDIVSECISSRAMFFSGGGVTFTGGEATLWADELCYVLCELQKNGIHTALETNGTSPRLTDIARHVDCLIMDFKHHDGEVLRAHTGVDCATVKKNFEKCCLEGRTLHIRIPLINGFNTDSPQGFAEYFSRFNTSNADFEFLPYHEYGKAKWKEEYKVKNGFVSPACLEEFKNTFKKYGLKVINT